MKTPYRLNLAITACICITSGFLIGYATRYAGGSLIFAIILSLAWTVIIVSSEPHTRTLLSGGRPMIRVGFLFRDRVSGKRIFHYRDRLGRHWLAEGPWSFFRVPMVKNPQFEYERANLRRHKKGWSHDA